MRKFVSLLLVFTFGQFLFITPISSAQDPTPTTQTAPKSELTNQDVLEMSKAGLASDVIVAKIQASATKFETSPSSLAELKAAGLSDAVIMAMVKAGDPRPLPAPTMEVKLTDGTEIEIQLKNTLSGQEAKVGDIVDFTIVRPVIVNGVTVFDKEASARARVTTAKKAGRWGKAGKLEWAMQDVQAVDGNRVPARFTKRELGDSKGGTVAVAAVATTVLLGPFGLLWGLKKGKPAIIPAGNRYSVFVHGDATVKGRPAPTAQNTAP